MVAQRPSGEPTFRGGPRFRRAARGLLSPRRSQRHERAPAGHGRARGKEDADEPCGRPLHSGAEAGDQPDAQAGRERRQDQDRQGVPARGEDHPGPVQGLSAIRHRQDPGRPPGAQHRQARHVQAQPALPRPFHRMSYREHTSSRFGKAQRAGREDGHARADDDPHEPHHALQSHLRRLLRGGVLARSGSRQSPPPEDRGRGQRHGRLPVHDARRRALHVRRAARLRARQQGRLLPGLHQRHAPRPRHHRRARQDRQHRADAQPRGLARAHRQAPGRGGARPGHGDHGPAQ